jgi:hypothetical protein
MAVSQKNVLFAVVTDAGKLCYSARLLKRGDGFSGFSHHYHQKL